ncbi:MAG: hotdog family protein [Planctomycetota bacterium]|jgi:3-hydroxyacyl-[acyl-carrier-protein] dehydratase
MHFDLIDDILEQTDDRIVVLKQVSRAEEYLADHFPGFPVLPGVLMIETMVQAARRLLAPRSAERLVLGEVRALKYGMMVRPGRSLEVEVTLAREQPDGSFQCRATGRVRGHRGGQSGGAADLDETAVTGRFTMRPVRVDGSANNQQG